MDRDERRIIDQLFARLREAEGRSGPRDGQAERLIGQHLAAQPAAPYYMAQAIVVQQEALAAAQARLEQLEREAAGQPGGGFLSGLFGGGPPPARVPAPPATPAGAPGERGGAGPWAPRGAGGGFLGGAMQTALGVAGGIMVANALTGFLSPDEAAAAEPGSGELEADQDLPEHAAADRDLPEAADELGGDFDFGEF